MIPFPVRHNFIFSVTKLSAQILAVVICFGLFKPTTSEGTHLEFPKPELCATRKIHVTLSGSGYYVTWLEKSTRNLFLNWLEARNWCRQRCMDLISLESPEEIKMVKGLIQKGKVEYCWTSGRLCDFPGCSRKDLKPISINGWFWSATDGKMRPTNERSKFNDWSYTGREKKPQPDNYEGKIDAKYSESCLAYLNNYYKDGIKWHDVSCGHIKSFICEDAPKLLAYAKSINKDKKLKF